MTKKRVTKAIIPAAGMGTRFLPATKSMPKEMLPIIDKPVLQYVIEEAIDSGIEDILIITGRGQEGHRKSSWTMHQSSKAFCVKRVKIT